MPSRSLPFDYSEHLTLHDSRSILLSNKSPRLNTVVGTTAIELISRNMPAAKDFRRTDDQHERKDDATN